MQELAVRTSQREEFVSITDNVQDAVTVAGVRNGACIVFVAHTTAGVTINENADPAVVRDMLTALHRLVPPQGDYQHLEGNSDAHLKASLMGNSVTIPVADGRLQLGTWQGIFFCEFDGPRGRKCWVRTLGE